MIVNQLSDVEAIFKRSQTFLLCLQATLLLADCAKAEKRSPEGDIWGLRSDFYRFSEYLTVLLTEPWSLPVFSRELLAEQVKIGLIQGLDLLFDDWNLGSDPVFVGFGTVESYHGTY